MFSTRDNNSYGRCTVDWVFGRYKIRAVCQRGISSPSWPWRYGDVDVGFFLFFSFFFCWWGSWLIRARPFPPYFSGAPCTLSSWNGRLRCYVNQPTRVPTACTEKGQNKPACMDQSESQRDILFHNWQAAQLATCVLFTFLLVSFTGPNEPHLRFTSCGCLKEEFGDIVTEINLLLVFLWV